MTIEVWNVHREIAWLQDVVDRLSNSSAVERPTNSSDISDIRNLFVSPHAFLRAYKRTLDQRALSFGPAVEDMSEGERKFVENTLERLMSGLILGEHV